MWALQLYRAVGLLADHIIAMCRSQVPFVPSATLRVYLAFRIIAVHRAQAPPPQHSHLAGRPCILCRFERFSSTVLFLLLLALRIIAFYRAQACRGA